MAEAVLYMPLPSKSQDEPAIIEDWVLVPLSDPLAIAQALLEEFAPINTKVMIEQSDSKCSSKYVVRMQYTSPKSGRTICMVAKGDTLPSEQGSTLDFYLRQLVLTPMEAAREFSRVYFLDRRARQEAFINSNYQDSRRIAIVSSIDADKDNLTYDDYAG